MENNVDAPENPRWLNLIRSMLRPYITALYNTTFVGLCVWIIFNLDRIPATHLSLVMMAMGGMFAVAMISVVFWFVGREFLRLQLPKIIDRYMEVKYGRRGE